MYAVSNALSSEMKDINKQIFTMVPREKQMLSS